MQKKLQEIEFQLMNVYTIYIAFLSGNTFRNQINSES